MYRLLFQGRLAERAPLSIREPRLWLGRDAACEIQLAENGVSPRHAVIERREDGYYISDLESEIGLRVNGQAVTQHRLNSGDEIELGSVALRFELAHDLTPRGRKHDWLLVVTAVVVVLLVFGQIGVLSWIFSQPRPNGRVTQTQPAQIDDEPPPPVAPAPAPVAPPAATPAPAKPAFLNRQIRIEKITESPDQSQMVVQVQARAQVGDRDVDSRAVAIGVYFFFRASDGTVSLWERPLWLNIGGMNNFASKTFNARLPVTPAQYAGCLVRTFYRNQLQDEAAKPAELLARAPALTLPE